MQETNSERERYSMFSFSFHASTPRNIPADTPVYQFHMRSFWRAMRSGEGTNCKIFYHVSMGKASFTAKVIPDW